MNLKLLAMLCCLSALLVFNSCDDDDGTSVSGPNVTAPSNVSDIVAGTPGQSVTFGVTVAGGLSATYEATGTNVTISNPSGSVSGDVTINYDADNVVGAASITLTVTDEDGQSDAATAVINLTDGSVVRIAGNITEDQTWETGKTYILGGRITVESDVTLTIQPGTLIKGEAGTGANATALLIARGGTLLAEGEADAPIIFTSVADEITPDRIASGDFTSPNLDPDINGLWGGLLVLGNATISASNDDDEDVSSVQIEGIPTSDPNGLYGGDDDADNSGVLKYISIRHGGSNIGEGNEINGLTLGGVGSATVIEHIEVVANQDDGIEWFGGTVDVTNAVVWNAGDDAIDTDQSWAGTLDNFVVVTPSGSCFELDGPEGTYVARHTIQNGTVVAIFGGRTTGGSLIDVDGGAPVDGGTPVDMENIHFVGPLSFVNDDDETVYLTLTNDEVDNTTFTNVTFDTGDINNLMETGDPVPAGLSTGGSPQADVSVLSWTWAAQAGGLDGL